MIGLVFVGDRCCDHSPSSGYDQLCSLFPQAGWLSGRALAAGREAWHRRPVAAPVRLAHVFYGDCSGKALFDAVRAHFPGARIVSTVHQPVARLVQDPVALTSLGKADALFTVSRAQACALRRLGVAADVHPLPHGVWTRAFRPNGRRPPARRDVLLVGNYLRDWEAARRIVALLARDGVGCLVVGSNAPADPFAGDHPVTVRRSVSEAELAQAYDGAAALLMPVRDATASNALLEAMSVGCPVVCCAAAPLVDEYLGDRADAFAAGEDEVAAARVRAYARDPARRAAASRALIARVERFDWARLVARYRSAYEAVLAQTREANCSSVGSAQQYQGSFR